MWYGLSCNILFLHLSFNQMEPIPHMWSSNIGRQSSSTVGPGRDLAFWPPESTRLQWTKDRGPHIFRWWYIQRCFILVSARTCARCCHIYAHNIKESGAEIPRPRYTNAWRWNEGERRICPAVGLQPQHCEVHDAWTDSTLSPCHLGLWYFFLTGLL